MMAEVLLIRDSSVHTYLPSNFAPWKQTGNSNGQDKKDSTFSLVSLLWYEIETINMPQRNELIELCSAYIYTY